MSVSVIIPFFNSAEFLEETLKSAVQATKGFDAEIIIVDDGSTEEGSRDMLNRLDLEGKHKIVRRSNGGPAAARNTGVQKSKGKYLLFLDSDNRLKPDFLSVTIPVMESNAQAGVIYGDASFFGETLGRKAFTSREFSMYELVLDNYIDVCSLVRREAFEQVNGFDESKTIIGYEDWDFWIRISATAWQFIYLPRTLFDYRLRKQSVITEASTDENYKKVLSYVWGKNAAIVQERYSTLYHEAMFYKRDKEKPFRAYLKFLKGKYMSR
jgi:glycosyltransferase involved in cell wall biosynthesis